MPVLHFEDDAGFRLVYTHEPFGQIDVFSGQYCSRCNTKEEICHFGRCVGVGLPHGAKVTHARVHYDRRRVTGENEDEDEE